MLLTTRRILLEAHDIDNVVLTMIICEELPKRSQGPLSYLNETHSPVMKLSFPLLYALTRLSQPIIDVTPKLTVFVVQVFLRLAPVVLVHCIVYVCFWPK